MSLGISATLICKMPPKLTKHVVTKAGVTCSQSPAYLMRYINSLLNLEITMNMFIPEWTGRLGDSQEVEFNLKMYLVQPVHC